MKRVPIVLGLLLALCLTAGPAMAQSEGAVIIRDTGEGWGYEWDRGNNLMVFSTFSNFRCGNDEAVPRDQLYVVTPPAAIHYRDRGTFFVRVYLGVPGDLTADPQGFICGQPYWAEGILHSIWYDNDRTADAPGANVWGHVFGGVLNDLVGACRTGKVGVNVVHLFRIAPHAVDYETTARVFKGPTFKCEN
jgi:hypothetical protein